MQRNSHHEVGEASVVGEGADEAAIVVEERAAEEDMGAVVVAERSISGDSGPYAPDYCAAAENGSLHCSIQSVDFTRLGHDGSAGIQKLFRLRMPAYRSASFIRINLMWQL